MGFDLSGLAPENINDFIKPSITWGDGVTDEERSKYFEELDKFKENVPGDYFRANVWSWRPLWTYVCLVCDNILTDGDEHSGSYNDGHIISKTKSKRIASRLRRLYKSGQLDKYLDDRDKYLNELDPEECELCEGTGWRDDAIGKKAREADPLYSCNGCKGKGEKKNWQCSYYIDKEFVKEFAIFCEKSGGFEIW